MRLEAVACGLSVGCIGRRVSAVAYRPSRIGRRVSAVATIRVGMHGHTDSYRLAQLLGSVH